MRAAILLVGEYQPLLDTRAQLLSSWEVVTAYPRDAPEALRERLYDLMILCQSVPDSTAGTLIALATSSIQTSKSWPSLTTESSAAWVQHCGRGHLHRWGWRPRRPLTE